MYEDISREKFEDLSMSPNITYHVRDQRTDTLVHLGHIEYTLEFFRRAEELCVHFLRGFITLDVFLKEMISEGFLPKIYSIRNVIPNEYIVKYNIYSRDCIN